MPYLLPEDTTPTDFKCITIRIPDDPQWESTFWGALTELCKWFNFDRDEAHNGTIVAHLWQEWIDEAMACNTITAMEFYQGRLRVQFCNSDIWVDIGSLGNFGVRFNSNGQLQFDLDGDGTFEVTQNIINTYGQGVNQLPSPNNEDAKCYIAQVMANEICDQTKDIADLLETGVTFVFANFRDAVNDGASEIPTFMVFGVDLLALGTVQFTYNAVATALEYIQDNMVDVDVVQQVANWIYCALEDSLIIVDGKYVLNDFEGALQALTADYFWEIFEDYNINLVSTLGLGNLNLLIGSLPKVLAGFAVWLSFSRNKLLGLLFDLEKAWDTRIIELANRAQFFDARDCADFVDCLPELIVTFDEGTNTVPYTIIIGTLYEQADDDNVLRITGLGDCGGGGGLHCVEFIANFEEVESINRITYQASADTSDTPPGTERNYYLIVYMGGTEIYNEYKPGQDDMGMQNFEFELDDVVVTDVLTIRIMVGTLTDRTCDLRADNIAFHRA